ncbi:penicillin-binding protein 1A [Arenicella chitinivorans]|uniref:Penicillin-binding protein 1A n=1 Tax=Arenicella chitinivorans TaxID=1329800 RepID=A0A918S1Y5_9GAMM|nr:penicillin-binding protein 1A [Arenicella chitinivorans]GHA20028.1 penicillin-binding protein 1A [Arenicella chitinivorans]
MKKSQLWLPLTTIFSGLFMAGFITVGFLVVQFSRELPDASQIIGLELKVPLRVFSAEGQLISEFGDERRKPLDYAEIPQSLINSVLASEDDAFFEHHGIDISGLIRAALSNFKSGSSGQGASTITMQVARNFFLTRDKTYARKIKEILLALRLEQLLSKEEILGLYINKIFLGHRAYGFGAAAEVYYGRPLNELTLAETAMLAGLPKAPSTYNPLRNPERATIRRNYVLGRLHDLELIDNEAYETASNAPVTAKKHARKQDLNAPHIAEMVRAQLTEQFGEQAYWQGLNVYTTIRGPQQNAANQALRAGLQAYDQRHGFRGVVGKIDLQNLHPVDGNADHAMELALETFPNSQEQVPALVLNSEQKQATVWTRDFGQTQIFLEHAKWARRHRTANIVGDAPKSMQDLVSAGDVVYIQPIIDNTNKTPTATATESRWRLSQIPQVSGSLISVEPRTGRILSLVGGYDFFLNKYNRAVQSIRQPGSNIKPFIYSASLDKGFTPASLISGAPIVMRDQAHGTIWRPENYSGKFYGPTRMRTALAKSMNLVSIRLLRAIGIDYAREYTARFGLDMNRFSPTLTMALGSGGVTPLELLRAYSTLANGGYLVEPYFIERVTDRDGEVIYEAPKPQFCDDCYADFLTFPTPDSELDAKTDVSASENQDESLLEGVGFYGNETETDEDQPSTYTAPRVMSHANNFLTVDMMKEVIRSGTARRAQALNRQDLAGKTGTTNDYVDAWFSGFNKEVATTVWIGFDDPATMGRGESGSRAALPIWVDYMQFALKGVNQQPHVVPEYIEQGFVNRATGKRTDESDPDAVPEYFAIDTLTPENKLYNDLLLARYERGELSEEAYLAAARQDTTLDTELDEGEQTPSDISPILDEPELASPEERIIETEEETEGLF